jgi:hypothetical protein
MSGTYAGTVDWHALLTVIEDGDDAVGETFTTPDQQVFDHTIALRDELETKLLRVATVTRTTLGAGTITDATFGSETGKLIYAAEIEVCGGGEGGTDGSVAQGGVGGVSGGYQRRFVRFNPPVAAINWSCYVGAGGNGNSPNGDNGEASWLDTGSIGDAGVVIGRGGAGTSTGLALATTLTVSVNGTTRRCPVDNPQNYPPDSGWGCVRSGEGGTAGNAGDDGGTCQCVGGLGGAVNVAGTSGRGYGAGGGGGRQASGTTAGGGGGAGGWVDNSVSQTTASGATAADGKQGAIRCTFLYADIMTNV